MQDDNPPPERDKDSNGRVCGDRPAAVPVPEPIAIGLGWLFGLIGFALVIAASGYVVQVVYSVSLQ